MSSTTPNHHGDSLCRWNGGRPVWPAPGATPAASTMLALTGEWNPRAKQETIPAAAAIPAPAAASVPTGASRDHGNPCGVPAGWFAAGCCETQRRFRSLRGQWSPDPWCRFGCSGRHGHTSLPACRCGRNRWCSWLDQHLGVHCSLWHRHVCQRQLQQLVVLGQQEVGQLVDVGKGAAAGDQTSISSVTASSTRT